MATCEEIKRAAKRVCQNPSNPDHFVLRPPVRLVNKSSRKTVLAWMLCEEDSTVLLVGFDAAYLVEKYKLLQKG